MTLLDHIIVLVEPVAGDEAIVQLAKEATASGAQVTVLLRLNERYRADVAEFARSEELDPEVAAELAIERVVDRYRSLIGPGTAVIPSGRGPLPLEHPCLAGATALAVPAAAFDEPRLRAELAQSPLPIVVAPGVAPARVPVGV